MSATTSCPVAAEQAASYRREGYVILPRVIPPQVLAGLRQECDALVAASEARKRAEGADAIQSNRHFIAHQHAGQPTMTAFLRSDLMLGVCRELLGPDVHLFYEQLVVKGPEQGYSFAWHQDSGYVGFAHDPYITLWCALDDATVENGTVWVLPWSRVPCTGVADHPYDEREQARVGYHGEDPGEAAVCPAGSIVAFSSLTFHRSGSNRTKGYRRAYVCQYSPTPIVSPDTGKPQAFAEPLLRGGERIRGG